MVKKNLLLFIFISLILISFLNFVSAATTTENYTVTWYRHTWSDWSKCYTLSLPLDWHVNSITGYTSTGSYNFTNRINTTTQQQYEYPYQSPTSFGCSLARSNGNYNKFFSSVKFNITKGATSKSFEITTDPSDWQGGQYLIVPSGDTANYCSNSWGEGGCYDNKCFYSPNYTRISCTRTPFCSGCRLCLYGYNYNSALNICQKNNSQVGVAWGDFNDGGDANEQTIKINASGTFCIPETCQSLGKQCGDWDNTCGTTLNCGTCSSGKTCNSNGQCVITPSSCQANQTILKLSDTTNAHGEVWNQSIIPGETITTESSGVYDFGGMYGEPNVAYTNPATGANTCPSGYTSKKILGTSGTDWGAYFCYKDYTGNPIYDFGGMYDYTDGNVCSHANPATGGCSCPSGYTSRVILGTSNVDYPLFFCYRAHSNNPIYDFGGMYGANNNPSYTNPATGGYTCPTGYTSKETFGHSGVDWGAWFCYKNHTITTTNTLGTGNYPISICYPDIFGKNYNGINPHTCTGTNKVVGLSSPTNAHAEIPTNINYPIDVCYGDLQCTIVYVPDRYIPENPPKCPAGYNETVRLSNTTNAHLETSNGIGSYPIKICCKSSAPTAQITGSTYWATMNNIEIGTAQVLDNVKLIWVISGVSPENVNFTIVKSGSISWNPYNWFPHTIGKITGIESTWNALEEGTYYFTAKNLLTGQESQQSDNLIVTSPENNYVPSTSITKPAQTTPTNQNKFLVGANISFEQSSSDEDDDLSAEWNFGDTTTSTLYNCLTTGNCNTNHSYSDSGTKTIRLTVSEETRDQSAEAVRIIYVYEEGLNIFAVITSPDPENTERSPSRSISFDASNSYVANCSTTCPSGKTCYNVTGIVDGITKTLRCFDLPKSKPLSGYDLLFDWTFDGTDKLLGSWNDNYGVVVEFEKIFAQAGPHTAALRVGYETS